MSASLIDYAGQFWLAALREPIGVGIVVTDPTRARRTLGDARKKLTENHIAGLDNYTIRTSPANPASELWIIRKS